MSGMFLPNNQVWLGFDDTGRSVAASIERRNPTLRKNSVMEGCTKVLLCHFTQGQTIFGLNCEEVEAPK